MDNNAEFLLGTVTAVSNANGIRIQIDGQDEPMTKYYKMMLTGADAPSVDDRVVVMKQSGTYIILGKIGTPSQVDGKVSRTGDFMTGDLNVDSSVYTVGVRPSGNYNDRHIYFRDKLKTIFGRIQGVFFQDGRVGFQMIAERTVSGSLIQNMLSLSVDESGTRTVGISAQPWRSALGLGTNGNLPVTIAQGGTGNTGVYWTTTVSEVATAGSGFSITYVIYAQWGKLAMVELGIKATEQVTVTTTTPIATIVTEKRPAFGASARAWLLPTRAAVITAAGNLLTNAGTIAAGSEFSFLSTYLLP